MKRLLTLLILLIKFQSSFSQSISPDSLVLHLPFDGNAKDISGNHYDGVVNGATLTTGDNNMPNTAYYFDGKSSIVIPDIKKLDRPLKAFTILIKLMVTNLDIDPAIPPPFYTNYNFFTWHRNSLDRGSSFMASKIRTDWQPESIDTLSKPFLDYVMNWCNISETASGYNNFKGKIDDLQIYTRALNQQEVDAYANNLCAEKPFAHLSVTEDTCRQSVMGFTDVSDMKGLPLYNKTILLWIGGTFI